MTMQRKKSKPSSKPRNRGSGRSFYNRPAKIDVGSIYAKLKKALAERSRLQQRQDQLWDLIRRTHSNRSREMDKISEEIGHCTYAIDSLIGQLGHYNKTHPAMKLAYDYSDSQIQRCQKIVSKWMKTVSNVDAGRSYLISSTGKTHTDTRGSREYIKKVQRKMAFYEKNKSYFAQYIRL